MNIIKCLEFAAEKHKDQKRKDGSPYINHPLAVMKALKDKGYGEKYQVAGLFHDLLEDTDATEDEILKYSDADVLMAVKLLTKTENNKGTYIQDILSSDIAKAVKAEDRIHNLKDARKGDRDFLKKYLKNTSENFVGKFGKELDNLYDNIVEENTIYTIDSSLGEESDIYKDFFDQTSVYNKKEQRWIGCDPFYWSFFGDSAIVVSKDWLLKHAMI